MTYPEDKPYTTFRRNETVMTTEEMKARLSARNWQIKQIVKLMRIIPSVSQSQMNIARDILEAEDRVREAKENLQRLQNQLFSEIDG